MERRGVDSFWLILYSSAGYIELLKGRLIPERDDERFGRDTVLKR